MSSSSFRPSPSSANKVTYFKHFPHYFLRPYDAQIKYDQQEFMDKLTSKNCEWTTRPKIALSEAAQAIQENWQIVSAGNYLEPLVQQEIENLVAPMQQVLTNLNSKDKSSVSSDQDVYEVMQWCFAQPQFDASLSNWMQQSAAFFVFLSQLRAMRSLITNPEQYASKLVNDEPSGIKFKNEKNIASLQEMLTKMCSVTPIAAPSSNQNVRQLAQQLVNPLSSGALQPPAGSTPIVSLPNEPSTSMHTVSSAPTGEPNFTNALMDMILSLQNQMQEIQRVNETPQQTADNTDKEDEQQKTRKRKRGKSSSTSTITCPEQLPTTTITADTPITCPPDDKPQQTRKQKKAKHSTTASSSKDVPITSSVDATKQQKPEEVPKIKAKKSKKTKMDK